MSGNSKAAAYAKSYLIRTVIGAIGIVPILVVVFVVGTVALVAGLAGSGAFSTCNPTLNRVIAVINPVTLNSSSEVILDGVPMTPHQYAMVDKFIDHGLEMGATTWDIYIGIMTGAQESRLRNLSGGDRDSAGVLQQRPSQGWGTYQQVTNPDYSIPTFYTREMQVQDRGNMSAIEVAIKVQVPDRAAYEASFYGWDGAVRQLMQRRGLTPPEMNGVGVQQCTSTLGAGVVNISPTANRPGSPISPETMNFLRKVAAIYGQPLTVSVGTNHSPTTVDGGPSDHWDGHAADFFYYDNGFKPNPKWDNSPNLVGDAIAAACMVAAGEDPAVAAAKASQGGLWNYQHDGLRIQCIWKTGAGGNHYDHPHIGANPL